MLVIFSGKFNSQFSVDIVVWFLSLFTFCCCFDCVCFFSREFNSWFSVDRVVWFLCLGFDCACLSFFQGSSTVSFLLI